VLYLAEREREREREREINNKNRSDERDGINRFYHFPANNRVMLVSIVGMPWRWDFCTLLNYLLPSLVLSRWIVNEVYVRDASVNTHDL